MENRRNSVREMRRLRQRLRDPRFRRLPKRLQKLPTDKRFKKLSKKLLEESQPDVDKFGRPLNRNRVLSEQQELQEYYQVLSDASSSEEEEVVPQVMETQATTSENTKEKLVVTEEASKEETGPVSSDSVPLGNETCRLAVTNMDWETLSASDILVILNSFCPESGQILSVSIHTTEYGKQWLSKESKEGPQLERFRDKALEVLNVDSQTDSLNLQQEEFDKRLSSEVARQYVLDKMKYYVGVVVCDSVATATSIYEQCDGLELESTGNVLDLRFIPDHIVFDDPPRDVAKQVPNSYEPKPFQSLPLQHTNGKLAWDEDDPHRAKLKKRRFTEQDLLDDDLRTYLASSDSEEEEDQEEKTQVYRQLASEVLQSGQNVKEEENLEMEATFISGLDNLGKKILVSKEQKELEAKESAWERRLRKMKKARKREKISEPSSVNDNSKQDAELDLLFMNEEKGYSSDEKREKPKTDDNFSLDTEDPRFAALYRSHDFALDPTDPRFKRTRGMKKLLHERSKRLYD